MGHPGLRSLLFRLRCPPPPPPPRSSEEEEEGIIERKDKDGVKKKGGGRSRENATFRIFLWQYRIGYFLRVGESLWVNSNRSFFGSGQGRRGRTSLIGSRMGKMGQTYPPTHPRPLIGEGLVPATRRHPPLSSCLNWSREKTLLFCASQQSRSSQNLGTSTGKTR